jgi:hypothetical protein
MTAKCATPPEIRKVTANQFFSRAFCVIIATMIFLTVLSFCDGMYKSAIYDLIIIALVCINNYLVIDRDNARLDLLDGYVFLSGVIDAIMPQRKEEEKNKTLGDK